MMMMMMMMKHLPQWWLTNTLIEIMAGIMTKHVLQSSHLLLRIFGWLLVICITAVIVGLLQMRRMHSVYNKIFNKNGYVKKVKWD